MIFSPQFQLLFLAKRAKANKYRKFRFSEFTDLGLLHITCSALCLLDKYHWIYLLCASDLN